MNTNKYNLIEASSINFNVKEYNIITYSWSGSSSHGICGHNFEAFELTIQRKDSIFLIPDNIEVANRIIEVFYSKYQSNFVDELIDSKRIYFGKPKIVTSNQITLCDGQMPTNVLLNCKTLEMILCGKDLWWLKSKSKKSMITNFIGKDIIIKHDKRLGYDIESIEEFNSNNKNCFNISFEHYIKVINFNLYKTINSITSQQRNYLVYTTGNCRDLFEADEVYKSNTILEIKEVIIDIPETTIYFVGLNREKNTNGKFLEAIKLYLNCNVKIIYEDELPADNLFEIFDTYIYTPTAKNWDCSSRLIPECFYFNKGILFTKTVIDNINDNIALKVRYEDYIQR